MAAELVMRQLPLDLTERPRPTLENFLAGPNAPAVAALAALADALAAGRPVAPVFLWGPPGCGKSHLLAAVAARALAAGVDVARLPDEATSAETAALLCIDDAHALDPAAQQQVFRVLAGTVGRSVSWVAAGDRPPVDLPLRDDLRSRLGWGPVFAIQPLSEADALAALQAEAVRHGWRLPDEVLRYLLTRLPRSLGTLMPLLHRLDAYSLAHGRPVTVPLLKQLLTEEGRSP